MNKSPAREAAELSCGVLVTVLVLLIVNSWLQRVRKVAVLKADASRRLVTTAGCAGGQLAEQDGSWRAQNRGGR